jgi:hypothetical protein
MALTKETPIYFYELKRNHVRTSGIRYRQQLYSPCRPHVRHPER